MSKKETTPENSPEEAIVTPPIPVGTQLAKARQSLGISDKDMAARLRISETQIQAIDAGEWGNFSCQTTARGFVRNYAKALRLDPDSIVMQIKEELSAFNNQPTTIDPLVSNSQKKYPTFNDGISTEHKSSPFLVLTIAILGIASLVYLFLFSELNIIQVIKPQTTETQEIFDDLSSIDSPDSSEQNISTLPIGITPIAPSETIANQQINDLTDQQNEVINSPILPEQALHFRFKGDSWVEIKDSNGKILLSQHNKAETEQSVNGGTPPYLLIIGNAHNVTLTYQENPVDLTQHTSSNSVARLKLP